VKIGNGAKGYPSSRRIIRFVGAALILGLAVGVFIYLFLGRQAILRTLGKVKLVYLLVPLLTFLAAHFIDTARLMLVLSQLKIRIPFAQAFYNSAVGPFFTNITPMSAGGQPFQIYHLCAIGVDKDAATNVILTRFVEQLSITMMLLLIFLPHLFIVTSSLSIARPLAWLALAITVFLSLALLSLLVWPSAFGRFALRLELTRFGSWVGRLFKRHDWCEAVYRLSQRLQASVRFLWREKIPIMIVDTLLGLAIMGLHAWSLYFVLDGVVRVRVDYLYVLISYQILWQIISYLPTPGASGGVEGAFALVYGSMTQAPESTLIAIIVWRFSTYYLLLLVEGLVYILLAKRGYARIARTPSPD
jgi:uncharacterized protein (TIRG00374 family)